MSYLDSLFSLSGKNAIVTGASRGLGRGAATALSSAGARVVLVGRDEAMLKETAGGLENTTLIVADVRDPEKMMEIVSGESRVDILINNAGIIRRATAQDYTAHDWYDVIDTDLNAVFSWAQAVGKRMIEQGSGKIINVASLLSFQGGLNVAAYAAAKGGVEIGRASCRERG